VKEACHVLLKKIRQGLQLCFRPHFNQRFSQEIMGVQSGGNANFGNYGTLDLGALGKKPFGCSPHGESQRILQGGRCWLPPSSGRGESCESMSAHGSFMHQKCFNYTLTNLLFGLCILIWIIDTLVTFFNPHLEAPTCLFYPINVVN